MRQTRTRFVYGLAGATAVAASLVIFAGQAHAQDDFGGRWSTNQGDLRIHQDGDRAYGAYTIYNGHLEGHTEGDRLSGIWWQTSANQRCTDERHGTHFWGRFRFHLSDNDESFRGRWSYCDEKPGDGGGGDWTGVRQYYRDRDHDHM